jgi:precorrin-3B C17-methyltransferase
VSARLTILGTGPGNPGQTTPEALDAIAAGELFFGYGPYLDRLNLRPDQQRIASDNREEIDRARAALEAASKGASVCVVSGGDPGVFAMAAAIWEAVEGGPETWRRLDIRVLPGVTAMLAVAARAGAPLGHDFCAISLSDNLKPWELIERRLRAVAEAGLVIALYNPISRARPWQLATAFKILREILPVSTPVIFGRAVGRVDEHVSIVPLGEADQQSADMATCVIIGSAETRVIERPDLEPIVYSPRGVVP